MKHIAYIIDTFPVVSETFILNEILELEKKGWTIDIYSLNKPPRDTGHPGAKKLARKTIYINDVFPGDSALSKMRSVIQHPFKYVQNVNYAKGLPESYQWIARACTPVANAIKQSRCDRIHAHFAGPAAQWAMMIAKYTGLPYTVTAHRYDIFDKPLPAVERLLGDAERVVTVSNYNKQFMVQNFGLDKSSIEVIPCGVDVEKFKFDENATRIKGQLLTVARLSVEKGLIYLIDAMRILKEKKIDFHLKVLGEGSERAILEDKIKSFGLERDVELLGAQPSDVVKDNMRKSPIFILPSLSEGLPVAYMEAMASGCAIVGTDVMGVKELVREGVVGFLVESKRPEKLADKILVLLNEPELVKRYGLSARKIAVNEFSLTWQAQRLIKMWSNLDR